VLEPHPCASHRWAHRHSQSVRPRCVVLPQHPGHPRRLPHLTPRPHLNEPRLDVQDRGAVHGVEIFDLQVQTINPEKTASRDTEPVLTAHVAVPEDPDRRPVGIVTRPPRTRVKISLIGQVNVEHDLQVGELVQAATAYGVYRSASIRMIALVPPQ
jgi:hypothetical protein